MKTKFSPEDYISRIESRGYKFVGWADETRRAKSKVEVICCKGHRWTAFVDTIVNGNRGCLWCAKESQHLRKLKPQQHYIDKINEGKFTFVEWVDGEYKHCYSRAVVLCDKGHRWEFTANRLINKPDGCPICSDKYRFTGSERAEQLSALSGISFVSWLGGEYKNSRSKAVVRCDYGHEWAAKISNLIHAGRRCPTCAKGGFDPAKRGAVYLLRSECGSVCKIGISNQPDKRLRQLRSDTPFSFNKVEICWHEDGRIAQQMELDLHRMHAAENAGLTGFSGCTEWFTWSEGLRQSFVDYRRSRPSAHVEGNGGGR